MGGGLKIWEGEMKEFVFTPKIIIKALKILRKSKKKEKHFWVEVENPKESGDFFKDVKVPSCNIGSMEVKPTSYFGEYNGENGKDIMFKNK